MSSTIFMLVRKKNLGRLHGIQKAFARGINLFLFGLEADLQAKLSKVLE